MKTIHTNGDYQLSYNFLIKKGTIIDGSGKPRRKADIGLKNEKIEKVGLIKEKEDSKKTKEINASDLIVCPGFIDIHSHADCTIPFDPKTVSTIHQGITTLVVGNCGTSLAPINPDKKAIYEKEFNLMAPPGEKYNITWKTFAEYLTQMEKLGCSSNVAHLVGFSNLRLATLGYNEREPSGIELSQMRNFLRESMDSGAFGLSTGLIYTPQSYAKTKEIIELAKVVGEYKGLYFSHIRSEGDQIIEAMNEFLEIVEKSKCAGGQIAHHKISGKKNWGKSKDTLKLIAEANKKGLNITADQYPYTRGMTSLTTLLPPSSHIGGIDQLLTKLKSPTEREKIRKSMLKGENYESFVKSLGWENIFLATAETPKWRKYEGYSFTEIAKELKMKDEFDILCEILIDGKAKGSMTIESMNEKDIKKIMLSPFVMIGSDSSPVAHTGKLSYGKPHPRYYGTYPRILGKYVSEEKVLKLEEAIRKMTSFPASKLGLSDRGLIKEGYYADIVIFDSKKIIDKATYTNPHKFPE